MITTVFAPRPMRVGALGLLLAVLLTVLSAAPGLAHDTLTDSSPADGDSGPPPTEVVLTFSGEIASVGTAVEVTGPEGVVSEGAADVDGFDVTQTLAADLPAGDYQVVWRVTSSDGHPISGEYAFTVEEAAAGDDATQTSAPATDDAAGATEGGAATTEDADASPTTEDPADTGTTEPVSGEVDEEGSGGMPAWTWVVIALALLGLGAVVVRVVRNSR